MLLRSHDGTPNLGGELYPIPVHFANRKVTDKPIGYAYSASGEKANCRFALRRKPHRRPVLKHNNFV